MKQRALGLLLVLGLMVALVPVSLGAASPPPPQSDWSQTLSLSEPTFGELLELNSTQPKEGERYEVTLITGDVVVVSIAPDGKKGIAIIPADPKAGQNFQVLERPVGAKKPDLKKPPKEEEPPEVITNTYVIPGDVDLTKLDMELFNIDYLIKETYYDLSYLPILVVVKAEVSTSSMRAIGNEIRAVAQSVDSHPLFSTVSAQLPLDNITDSYRTLMKLDPVEKVWLDSKVYPDLSQSVPLIGAPEMWDAGYTGAGVTIAILDTGIDKFHPDLDDLDDNPATSDPKVIEEVNFTDDPTAEDGYGHGTHCASIAAGTGAAPAGVPSPTHIWFSGADDYLDNTLDHTFDLSGVSSATLRFWTSYNTESYWDFGYVRVSVDGGSTWDSLDTYEGSSDGWVEKSYDLTPYVGGVVIVRFEYVTDFSVVYPGWFIDDIEIDEIGFFDDVESGPGDWVADGWTIEEVRFRGVAPGAWLYNVKVLNQYGSGWSSWIINGIEYAVLGLDETPDTGDEADIISMSLGGGPTDGNDPLSLAVDWAVEQGVVVVVAAGNWGDYFTISAPGAAREVITVGASTKGDDLAWLSSMGPTLDFRVKPDVVAPGVDIIAARAAGTSMGGPMNDFYTSASGTSMATPHVAGATALMLEANPTIPLGWSAPKFVKNSLMSHAVDLDYDVYAQGAGRIDVLPAASPLMLIDPTTTSFGVYSEDATDSQVLTFYNLDSVAHDLELNVWLTEILSENDYSGSVTLTPSLLTVPAGSSNTTTLEINTTGLPKGVYSGRVEATFYYATGDTGVHSEPAPPSPPGGGGGGGATIHAIFGFAKLNELTIEKIDMYGNPGTDHYVFIFADADYPWSWFREGITDEYGRATFHVPDNDYQIAGWSWNYDEDASIFTSAEEEVYGNTFVTLDVRVTVPVDFDPNKIDPQVIAEKNALLVFEGDYVRVWSRSIWRYPETTLVYVSPTTSWVSNYTYSYHPLEFLNYEILETPEWAKLRYGLDTITAPVTFVADYTNLVSRLTIYSVALGDDEAERVQFAQGPPTYVDSTFGWKMRVPQVRVETLSPYFEGAPPTPAPGWVPVCYHGWYSKWEPRWQWDFWMPVNVCYPPGEAEPYVFGGHPFNSGASLYVGGGWLEVGGYISADTMGNAFADYTRWPGGHLTIEQAGQVVFERDIWDHFNWWFDFEGTPETTVIIDSWTPLALSGGSYTRLDFTADPGHDYRPPKLRFSVPGINLFGITPGGGVEVKVGVTDDSPIESVNLDYSLDDGETWNDAGLPLFEGGWYVFNLGELPENTFVTLAVDAEDEYGNHIHHKTVRAFGVAIAASATYPCLFYGTATVNDEPVAADTEITAWVEVEQVGLTHTGEGDLGPNEFTLTVQLEPPADVSFKIGELDALVNGNPTIPFEQYGAVEANLTAWRTIPLWEGANPIHYTGATMDLPAALTNIADITEVVWQRDTSTGGEWWYYLVPLDHGPITQLENGRVYIVVVSEDCTWELSQ